MMIRSGDHSGAARTGEKSMSNQSEKRAVLQAKGLRVMEVAAAVWKRCGMLIFAYMKENFWLFSAAAVAAKAHF